MAGDALCSLHCEIDPDCFDTPPAVRVAYHTSVRQFVTGHHQLLRALKIVVAAYLPVPRIVTGTCVLVAGRGLYTDN
jgi:hypothetical protein